MDRSSARGAKLHWQAVLNEYDARSDRDVSIWYFHEAAMESQLCFHSTRPVDSTDPSAPEKYCSPISTLLDYICVDELMLTLVQLYFPSK